MTPAEAFHPSVLINEELEARGWSVDDLARKVPGEFEVIRLALDVYLTVGADEPGMHLGDLALGLSEAFGVDRNFFTNLERAWFDHPTTKAALAKERH